MQSAALVAAVMLGAMAGGVMMAGTGDPPPGCIDISVPIIGNGDLTVERSAWTPTAGPWREDLTPGVKMYTHFGIPFSSDRKPAVKYARVSVRYEDVEKIKNRIPEKDVPKSDLMIVAIHRSQIHSVVSHPTAARVNVTNTMWAKKLFEEHADWWTTPEGKAEGRKVLDYLRDRGTSETYCNMIAEQYELNEQPADAADVAAEPDQP